MILQNIFIIFAIFILLIIIKIFIFCNFNIILQILYV